MKLFIVMVMILGTLTAKSQNTVTQKDVPAEKPVKKETTANAWLTSSTSDIAKQEPAKPLGGIGVSTKFGSWEDTSASVLGDNLWMSSSSGKLILSEDYEVVKTHEICASVSGYFMEASRLGRYYVSFKGMRTSAQFVFTTQIDAEHWVQKFCTPDSLLNIKSGKSTFSRSY